jgi:type II secretory pathway component PulF
MLGPKKNEAGRRVISKTRTAPSWTKRSFVLHKESFPNRRSWNDLLAGFQYMIFSTRIPLSNLIELCRVLRHNLAAGLTLRDVFRQQAERGPAAVRPIAGRIRTLLENGDSLESALDREKAAFPPLFLSMAAVGEETGQLSEIFGELEKYYVLQQKLRRQVRSQSMLPLIQLALAFLVIALLIFVLGMIGQARNTKPPSVFGLRGGGGALAFLGLSFGSIMLLVASYLVATRRLRQKPLIDAFLLRVPVVGPCVEALVMARFALALQLTLETGMPIAHALRLSLHATGNAAFAAKNDIVRQAIKSGEDLTSTLDKCHIFPEAFVNMIAIAEEGGRIPEMMRHQADYYNDEASRRLTALTRVATFGVWLLYAIFMVIAIFSIANMYLSALNG